MADPGALARAADRGRAPERRAARAAAPLGRGAPRLEPGHRGRGRARTASCCPASRSRPTTAPGPCTRRRATLPRTSSLFQPEQRLLLSGDHLLGRVSLYFDYGWTPDPVAEFLDSLDTVERARRAALPTRSRPAVRRRAGAHRGEPRRDPRRARRDRSARSASTERDRLRAGAAGVRPEFDAVDDELGADDHALLPRPTSSEPGGSERVRSPDEQEPERWRAPAPTAAHALSADRIARVAGDLLSV